MKNIIKKSYTFDDVLLVPKYTEINSRSEVNLNTKLYIDYELPVVASNMKTIVGKNMIEAFYKNKGLSIMHRFSSMQEQMQLINNLNIDKDYLSVSVGVKNEDYDNVLKFIDLGINIFTLDIAHAHSKSAAEMINYIKKYNKYVIAGNISTKESAKFLWNNGADTVKVGIGGGSICTTRIETGNGVPMLTSIMWAAEAKDELSNNDNYKIISDGGISKVGDIAKALCFAEMVMCGNMFAGSDETPGDIIEIDGRKYKRYDGSSTYKVNHIEGVNSIVESKGPVQNIINKIKDGLKSACSYQGVNNLNDLKINPEFVEISNSGLVESNHHNVKVI